MANIVKISVKNFNASKLMEELASLPIIGVGWAGFTKADARTYQPIAARTLVGRSVSGGVVTEDFADPGELRFSTSRDLTAPEDSSLTGILAAHVSTALTVEQQREDQDEADLDALVATELQQYRNLIQTWDSQNTTQKLASAKTMFTTLGKVMRFLLRQQRSGVN